jgi:two-component system, sensor histidine kinase and response regulator
LTFTVPATILNVDDNEISRYTRTRFLTRAGFSVVEARDGQTALQLAQDGKPDLVLLDINLPDVNGLEVCRQLRTGPETGRIPVVFLTASRLGDPDVVIGLDAGGDNYLREPVDPGVLIATIRSLLRAREAEEELARSNEQLRRFAFVVSHELQEPLRMVKSYTQLLERRYTDRLEPNAIDYIANVVDGVERMERFIRDMLSYSQSVEGGLDIRATNLRTTVDMALLELDHRIRETGATVNCEPLPLVSVDARRMSQVFRNLIGNAIKYRSEAAPQIIISSAEVNQEYVISVNDNGIGIDPRYADSVFILFKRLHGPDKAGTGVGLSVCKEIVEHHGGRIWVESQPGHGATFRFTLPKN